MSKRTDAKKQVEEYKIQLAPLLNTEIHIRFDKFCFPMIITDIVLARLSDLENKPEVRQGEEKGYRPPVMTMQTNEGSLHFVLEDIEIRNVTNGVKILTDKVTIEMRLASYDSEIGRQ